MASSHKTTLVSRTLAIVVLCLLLFVAVFCSVCYGTESGQTVEEWKRDHADEQRPLVVNINTATVTELLALEGMDTETAENIVNYRDRLGRFATLDELGHVSGVSEEDILRWTPYLAK